MSEKNSSTTLEQAREIEQLLIRLQTDGERLDVISPAYIRLISQTIKHVRLRMARSEWV